MSCCKWNRLVNKSKSSPSEVFLGQGVLEKWSKFTGEHPCRSVISVKLQSNLIEIALQHRCSPVNLVHIFRVPFPRNTSEWLRLDYWPTHKLNLDFLEKSLFFPSHFVYNFSEKIFLIYILLTDQISLSDCLYFLR